MKKGKLLAGAGRADITPELGIQLAGDIGTLRPAEEIRERLYVNVLVLKSGKTTFCFLSLDLLSTTTEWADAIRLRAARKFGLDPKAIVVHVTQNHASPSIGHLFMSDRTTLFPPEYPWIKGGDDRYNEPAVAKCLEAIDAALQNLRPATIRVGRGVDGRVAFNRRFVLRDGTAQTHPPKCDPSILYSEGPADPEVGVMTLTDTGGHVISGFLHHTCHPCHGYPHRYVIGDWPGVWAETMRKVWGDASVPLVINGCCGNIHHCNHLNPGSDPDHRQMAQMLGETSATAMGHMEPLVSDCLAMERSVLRLPMRKLTQKEVAAAQAILRKYPEPKWLDAEKKSVDWDWVYAVGILDLKRLQDRTSYQDYEIQVFRIGDMALVALRGEPFVEAQLAIKQASPAPYTFVAHFCNGYAGYIPTEEAFARGGYETRTCNGSKFKPDALKAITNRAIRLLKKLFP